LPSLSPKPLEKVFHDFIICLFGVVGPQATTDKENIAKYEIMDGCPKEGVFLIYSKPIFLGEVIPIRLYLTGYELTPSYKSVSGKFSVKYYINLILVDEDDRRYFKQQEITLWRKK